MRHELFSAETAILTARTVVRRFREGDGPALATLTDNNRVYLSDYFPAILQATLSRENAEQYVREKMAAWLLQQEYIFGVWENQNARLIGVVQLTHIEWNLPRAELSFFLDQTFTGKGLMTEVLQAVIRFAFAQLTIEKLSLRAAMENYDLHRLARKCGFRREGDLRAEMRKATGDYMDVMLFGLTRTESGF